MAGAPPRVLVWIALFVCAAGVVMTILGAWRVGISSDEPVHLERYENLQQRDWYLLDDDFDGDQPGSWVEDRYVYGPVFTEVQHAVNRVIGLDPADRLGGSVDAYATRHVVVALCALVALLAVVLLARRLLGTWSWGLVAGATLTAIPMWTGLAMFDFKDVPAATGYTLVTLALVEMLSAQRASWGLGLWHATLLAAGLILGIGSRPGLWPGLAASLGLAAVAFLLLRRDDRAAYPWRVPLFALGACLMAYAVLWLAYPVYFSQPDEWVLGSVLDSSDYTAGPTADTGGSWAYLPANVLVLVPPLLLLVGCIGCVATLSRQRWAGLTDRRVGWLLVASQALLLPLLAVVGQSLLYDGLRQVLFACPAVALLLTKGWATVVGDLARSSSLGRLTSVLWAAALLVPMFVQLQLFPYGYTYVAPQASLLGATPLDDYWRVSYRELLPQVPRGEFVVCYPMYSEQRQALRTLPATGRPAAESSSDCRTDPASTIEPFGLAKSDPDRFAVDETFLAILNRGQTVGSNCEQLGSVERWRYFARATMSTVARCELVLYPYPEGGVEFRPDGAGADYLLGGWTAHPAHPGVALSEPAGSLGFQMPATWTGRPLHIDLEGQADDVPQVRVNNAPAETTATAHGWAVDVPATTASALGASRLAVTILQGSGAPVRLVGVTVEPS